MYGVPPSYGSATALCLQVAISFRGSPWEGPGCQAPVTKRQLPGEKSTLMTSSMTWSHFRKHASDPAYYTGQWWVRALGTP